MDNVIFKLEGKDVVAFFPDLPGTSAYDCTCYAHVGQHGSADIGYASLLKPARLEQYASLASELTQLGYEVRPVRRFTQKHFAARKRAMQLERGEAV